MPPDDSMKIRLTILPLSALLVSCTTTEQSGFVTVFSQPANVGDAGIAARQYHHSGAYDRDLRVVASQAASWIKMRAAMAHQPVSAADFKTPIRIQIERLGYTIIANMGDQPSDLLGGHAEKKFLLPDPFYRVP